MGKAIKTGANTSDVTILWGEGAVVGKAIYEVNDKYAWDLEINVVQVKISQHNNLASYPGASRQSAAGSQNLVTNLANGDHAMTASFVVEKIKGPTVNGTDRGVKFLEMGQIHHTRFTKERAFYDDVAPAQQRVGSLEGHDNGNWIFDAAQAGTIPWTFQNNEHYLKPANDNEINNRTFSTFDGPTNWITDMLVVNGDIVDRNELIMEHLISFAIRTTQSVNGSDDVYTQRLRLNWSVNASGTYDNATGVWTYNGPGDGVDGDPTWTEQTDGTEVPRPTTNDNFNDLLQTEVWNQSNQ